MDIDALDRMSFENTLTSLFDAYYDIAQVAMTTGQNRTRADYRQMENYLTETAENIEKIIEFIPKNANKEYKEDVEQFLTLMAVRLYNIRNRYSHLEGKAFDGEYYTFQQDRTYIKNDRKYEKQISKIGKKINKHRDETRDMLGY